MTPFAHRYINARATLAVLVLLAALFFGLRGQDAQRSAVAVPVQATVVAADAPATGAAALPTFVVELADGTRVRLAAGNRLLAVGETVTLLQTTAGDGARRYQLQSTGP
jgi:hypothetical protein